MFKKSSYFFIASFLTGIFYHSMFLQADIGQTLLLFLLLISFLVFLLGNDFLRKGVLCITFFLFGFFYFHASIDIKQKQALDYFANQKIEIELQGRIAERPVLNDFGQSFVVDTTKILLGENNKEINTKILVRTYDQSRYQFGDIVHFSVVPEKPKAFAAEKGRIFDYEHFLEKDGIYYVGKSTDIRVLGNTGSSFIKSIYSFKDRLLQKMYRFIPKPESSLLAGILLGEKTALGDKLENDFRTTGLMHIVVLSGYNVSLVILAVMMLLRWLPIYARSIIAVVAIILFALLVGAGPTVLRASLMALFLVLAKVIGRPYAVARALVFAGLIMIFYNPWVLYFDISFQFSFLATFGLIVFPPLLEKYFSWVPEVLMLRESALATISAQIMVAPLILYYIGDFSTVSILVNMLVLFIVPVAMGLGFLTAVFGFVIPIIAEFFALLSYFSLKYILLVVDFFARVPFAKFTVQSFSFYWIILWYVFVYFLVCRKKILEFIQKQFL